MTTNKSSSCVMWDLGRVTDRRSLATNTTDTGARFRPICTWRVQTPRAAHADPSPPSTGPNQNVVISRNGEIKSP